MKNLSRNDLGTALGFIVAGLAAAAFAWLNGHAGWSAFSLILCGGMAVITLLNRRFPCPRCGAQVKFEAMKSIARCESCHDYFCAKEGRVEKVAPGTMAEDAVFSARFEDMKPPSDWVWPDPELCSVCRKPTDRQRQLTVTLAGRGIVMAEAVKWKFNPSLTLQF